MNYLYFDYFKSKGNILISVINCLPSYYHKEYVKIFIFELI